MKKTIELIIIFVLVGCSTKPRFKFEKGSIVHHKLAPSLPLVIVDIYDYYDGASYRVTYYLDSATTIGVAGGGIITGGDVDFRPFKHQTFTELELEAHE